MGKVRAKFRCMSITSHWRGRSEYRLLPIIPQSGDPSPENEVFWKYTPGGEATYWGDLPIVAGDAVYIDMDTDDESSTEWRCGGVSIHDSDGNGSVELYGPRQQGRTSKVELTIDNPSAVAHFKPGKFLAVAFTKAPLAPSA